MEEVAEMVPPTVAAVAAVPVESEQALTLHPQAESGWHHQSRVFLSFVLVVAVADVKMRLVERVETAAVRTEHRIPQEVLPQ